MTKGLRITKTMKAATKAGEGVLTMSQKRKEAWSYLKAVWNFTATGANGQKEIISETD